MTKYSRASFKGVIWQRDDYRDWGNSYWNMNKPPLPFRQGGFFVNSHYKWRSHLRCFWALIFASSRALLLKGFGEYSPRSLKKEIKPQSCCGDCGVRHAVWRNPSDCGNCGKLFATGFSLRKGFHQFPHERQYPQQRFSWCYPRLLAEFYPVCLWNVNTCKLQRRFAVFVFVLSAAIGKRFKAIAHDKHFKRCPRSIMAFVAVSLIDLWVKTTYQSFANVRRTGHSGIRMVPG